ncbi:MAG: 50S ribosomal protein L1 [Berkelbacteria bacterium GW2011_GWE1_39_12]|uniref:Ribosomal protein n=1 Tax=Berkelbacteria bacterium GW2011_GWE1_39_12 TaxID=1618337 RepID=A0A0G4B366_9BACT|nr:MAG: 50S ribosomal protein L1 [Berkelbacteria bacterium GW2011_GWE1_39_12]
MGKNSLDDLISQSEEAIDKGEDLSDIDADHHGKAKVTPKANKEKIAEKIRQAKFQKEAGAAAGTEEKEGGEEKAETQAEKESGKKTKAKKVKRGKAKVRSKKYQEVKALIEVKEKYSIDEALELVKKTTMTKFDGNVETHVRLLSKTGKPEAARGLLQYPFGTGKKINVVILDEKLIDEIVASKKIEADIYLVTPALMPKAAKLAKILGPKGKMPNPKAGTITLDPEKTKADLEGGQVEYKTDSTGNIHQVIGKVSGKIEELTANFKELIAALPNDKINSIHICATMGPSVKVKK